MAPRLQACDRRFPPLAPIPGRGLPPDVWGRIPTVRLRLLRGGGLFVTSLGASAALAVGPAVVLAKLGAGGPVIVEAPIPLPPTILAGRATGGTAEPGRQLRRERQGVRSRAPVVVAGTGGAPRGGPRDRGVAARGAAPPASGRPAFLAAGQGRWCPCPGTCCTLARRPRPPPASGNRTPRRQVALIALVPGTSPHHWWCAPGFLFSRA